MVRGKGTESLNTQLAGKAYKDGIAEVIKATAVRPSDLDSRAIALLDALQATGRGQDACDFLKSTLAETPRDRIQNWRRYLYTLLRGFDSEVYTAMKAEKSGDRKKGAERILAGGDSPQGVDARPSIPDSPTAKPKPELNQAATEFVPGKRWSYAGIENDGKNFSETAAEFVPGRPSWAGSTSKKAFNHTAAEFVPGQMAWTGVEGKPQKSGNNYGKQWPAPAVQAKASGERTPQHRKPQAAKARSDEGNGKVEKQAPAPAKVAVSKPAPAQAAPKVDEPAAEAKVPNVVADQEPWWRSPAALAVVGAVVVAAVAIPVMRKRRP